MSEDDLFEQMQAQADDHHTKMVGLYLAITILVCLTAIICTLIATLA